MAGTLVRHSQTGPYSPLDASAGVINGAHRLAFYASPTQNVTFEFNNVGDGCQFSLLLNQDTPAVEFTWPNTLIWPGGFAPNLMAGEQGVYTFLKIGGNFYGNSAVPATKVVFNEDLSGLLDGTETIFELADAPVSGFHMAYLNGVKQTAGSNADYMVSGKVVTMAVAPQEGEVLQFTYVHNGNIVAPANGENGEDGADAVVKSTSTSSVAVGTGNKSFTTTAAMTIGVGAYVVVSKTSGNSNWMLGQVSSISGTSLVVNVSDTNGSGTHTDWTLTVCGPRGVQGETGAAGATGADGADGGGGLSITQTAHGLSTGEVVRFNGTVYVKAQGNSAQNSEVVGVVDVVGSANAFHIALPGDVITTLSGLTAGAVYFLDAATAGATSVDDVADGEVSKPVMVAISTSSAIVLSSRGVYKVAGSDPSTEVFNEPPSGDLDGTNATFTLEFTPDVNSLRLYLNGVRREEDTDFTLSGVTVVFNVAPIAGSVLLADYVKA